MRRPLDRGDYPRKPRGLPPELAGQTWKRTSLCCRSCRGRTLPPSLRFPDRGQYVAWFRLSVSEALKSGKKALLRLAHEFGVPRSTLRRWQSVWCEIVQPPRVWEEVWTILKSVSGCLPASTIDQMACPTCRDRLLRSLHKLCPAWLPDTKSVIGCGRAEHLHRTPSFPVVDPVLHGSDRERQHGGTSEGGFQMP